MTAAERRRGERGYALLTALVVLSLVAVALALLSGALLLRLREVRHEAAEVQRVAFSDASVAEALAALASDPDYPGTSPHPFRGAILASRVQRVSTHRYRVFATAAWAGVERQVELDVARVSRRVRAVDPGSGEVVETIVPRLVVLGWRRVIPGEAGSGSSISPGQGPWRR